VARPELSRTQLPERRLRQHSRQLGRVAVPKLAAIIHDSTKRLDAGVGAALAEIRHPAAMQSAYIPASYVGHVLIDSGLYQVTDVFAVEDVAVAATLMDGRIGAVSKARQIQPMVPSAKALRPGSRPAAHSNISACRIAQREAISCEGHFPNSRTVFGVNP
jgi:hypothetical protein